MIKTILRKEHKNKWERRTCLTPETVKKLITQGYPIDVETSEIRVFPDVEYVDQGCKIVGSPNSYQFVLGIKEPPVESIQQGQIHLCFSHTHKGQSYNMPLLEKFRQQKATLLDYELITDDNNNRTIAFGRYAGIAGAVDTLGLAGQKYQLQGNDSPLIQINQSWQYRNESDIRKALNTVTIDNRQQLRVVIVGSGKVGRGAEEVCQWLGLPQLSAEDFITGNLPLCSFYTVLSSRHIYRKKGQKVDVENFDFNDYLEKGSVAYESLFYEFLGQFDILIQTPYWEEKYPKLLPLNILQKYEKKLPLIVGDISADIDGSLSCTKKSTDTDHPVYTYFPQSDSLEDGLKADGLAVMCIDNLPCELSMDSSCHFSAILPEYIPAIMDMDLSLSWDKCNLPQNLKRATIVYQGELTPQFAYLEQFLDASS
ncbi:MAG TPA: alanine dehydrogenase [Aeromonadales bacterium]|nr:alanine dehydrogenase [Aeromonadales bacterium]